MSTPQTLEPNRQYLRRFVSNQDRRNNGRIYLSASAVIESLDSVPADGAMVINYSDGGLYFESDALITPGAVIYLGLCESPYNPSSTTYECHRVKIRWCKDPYRSDYKFGYGAQHLDPIGAYTVDSGEQFYDLPKYLKPHHGGQRGSKKDNRKHPRKSVSRKVLFTTANKCYEGRVTDVSKGGFFIVTTGQFSDGENINIVVPGTKFDKGIMIKAQIVRLTDNGIGVKFAGLLKKEP